MANEKYDINTPQSEQEIPPDASRSTAITSRLPDKTVEQLERENQIKRVQQEINLKDKAFALLCWCLGSFAFFYIADTVLRSFGFVESEILSSAVDMAKTVVTFLIGYLFATEKNKN